MYWLQLNTVWQKEQEKAGKRERPFPCEWKQAVKVGGDQDGVNEMMTAGVRGKTPVVIYKPLPCRAEGYTGPSRGKNRRLGQCHGSKAYFTPHGPTCIPTNESIKQLKLMRDTEWRKFQCKYDWRENFIIMNFAFIN